MSEKLQPRYLRAGAATDDPPAVEDGPPRRPRPYPVVYSHGRLRAPERDSHDFGACALRLASERRPGRAGGVALTRAPAPRKTRLRARSDYARRAIQSSALPRRAYGGRGEVSLAR
jgi:hypothetical protein